MHGHLAFSFQIILWLWFTVLFANFAEAVAEGRGKAQADSLRRTRTETQAKLLAGQDRTDFTLVPGASLKVGDVVLVEAGDIIPSDGEVIEGVASVNEAAITGRIGTGHPRDRAVTVLPSPAARRCSRTGSACASPQLPGRPSSTA